MAFSLGTAILTIKANATQMTRGLAGAKAQTQNAMASMAKSSRQVGMAFTAASVAIVGSMTLAVTSFAAAGDEIQKMALRTGFSTEALSELKHAAELSGTSLGALETAVRKMSRLIFEASTGSQEYIDTLDALGVTYRELATLTPEQQFNALLMALADVENQTIKAALAQEIFGRAGTALLPMLAEGSAGLAEMRREAHDLGIVFDQEAANAAAEFQDNILRLKKSFMGISNQVAKVLIPVLNNLVPAITENVIGVLNWMKANPKLTLTIVKFTAAAGLIMGILGPILTALPGLAVAFGGVSGLAGGVAGATVAMVGAGGLIAAIAGPVGLVVAMGLASISIGRVIEETTKLIRAKREAREATDQAEVGERRLIQTLQNEGVAITEAEVAGLSHNEMMKLFKERIDEAEEAQGREISALNGVRIAMNDGTTAIMNQRNSLALYDQSLGFTEARLDSVARAAARAKEQIAQLLQVRQRAQRAAQAAGPAQAFQRGGTQGFATQRGAGGGAPAAGPTTNTFTAFININGATSGSVLDSPRRLAEQISRELATEWRREASATGFANV